MEEDIIQPSQPMETPTYRCPRCSKAYKSRSGLTRHQHNCKGPLLEDIMIGGDSQEVIASSQPLITEHKCVTCSKTFLNKSNLTKHSKNCAETMRRLCRYCEATFNSFAGLRTHESRTPKKRLEQAKRLPKPVKKSFRSWRGRKRLCLLAVPSIAAL